MKEYLDAMRYIRDNGQLRTDRTGTGTIGVFGTQQRYNLRTSFPAPTTKKLAFKAVVGELLWFLEGSQDERRLAEITYGTRDMARTTIWSDNAYADYWTPKAEYEGHVGKIYGYQWRNWGPRLGPTVDQIKNLIAGIKKDPFGRRHIITAWQPGELDQMALPPCHVLAQFYVSNNNELSCQLYQRSNDFFLGCPFNIASYSLLTHMIAQVCGLKVGDFVHTTGDAHLYSNHAEQVEEQLSREIRIPPTLWINQDVTDIDGFTINDFKLIGYDPHPSIPAPMSK